MKCFHSHTQFCDGRSTMEEILRSAVAAGFSEWGFTPHAPISIDSPCNMKEEDVPKYFGEIERLRNQYPDIRIFAGMEVDYLSPERGPASENVKSYGLDYVIGSVHFIPNQEGVFYDIDGSPERFARHLKDVFHNDLAYVIKTFWKQTQQMIAAGGLDIIGHIDKIALNASFVDPDIEKNPEYISLAEETIRQAINAGLQIEINTKHYGRYGRFFPHPRYWKRIADAGIAMPVNSDAHTAETVASGMTEARTLLDEILTKNT